MTTTSLSVPPVAGPSSSHSSLRSVRRLRPGEERSRDAESVPSRAQRSRPADPAERVREGQSPREVPRPRGRTRRHRLPHLLPPNQRLGGIRSRNSIETPTKQHYFSNIDFNFHFREQFSTIFPFHKFFAQFLFFFELKKNIDRLLFSRVYSKLWKDKKIKIEIKIRRSGCGERSCSSADHSSEEEDGICNERDEGETGGGEERETFSVS